MKFHISSVRASREGDQFHYLWAARRCLRLLSFTSDLVAVSIEGASLLENAAGSTIDAGEEAIDVGEYYGSENLEDARLVEYIQLKHSTLRAADHWTLSGLETTLKKFAERYIRLRQSFGPDTSQDRFRFRFVSNRPINPALLSTVEDARNSASGQHPEVLEGLRQITGLRGPTFSEFCKVLRLDGDHKGQWDQRNILFQDVSAYLADADFDAPTQLKELVTRKALPESASNPSITRVDVLRALKTDESHLFPAPCRIGKVEALVRREQESTLADSIAQADGVPIILHADAGVGKSVCSMRVGLHFPEGSVALVYDSFGSGQYRSATGYRHRHRDALVQIANELASKGLCHPLIPTHHAEPSDYLRAFLYRLGQCVKLIRGERPDALLCIMIDAADNAQMAAEEIGETRSFVRDLLREQIPDGVRIVAFCRTYRQDLLDPPPHALRLELHPFDRVETAAHLRHTFPDATAQDIDEFHRLSSHNPRVQSMALSRQASLAETLRRLGPDPTTVPDAIGQILDDAIGKLRDNASAIERHQIERICTGLAALRPLVPISVLASMSGISEAAIRSFAFDLGRPLIVTGETIQFFDEPAETWFRDRYKPNADKLGPFIDNLKPLASGSAYVAAALPQLMLEAGQFDQLVAVALSSEGLPDASPVERRDVELQRLQFALKASLRAKRYVEAAKLALKAGGESAGDKRRRMLIQANTDLAAKFMDSERIEELVSRRTFGSGWLGSHHVYEAGVMSGRPELLTDARSRLRMALEWLVNWSSLSSEEREQEHIADLDIAELAIAEFNIHGAASSAGSLRRWRPREVSFRAGRILARRFIDHGRYEDLDDLAVAAGNHLGLILAITIELRQVHRNPPQCAVQRALRLLLRSGVKLDWPSNWDVAETLLHAIAALVEAAYKQSVCKNDDLAALLTRYLPTAPPRHLFSRFGKSRFPLLHAYTLRAGLEGESMDLHDLAHPELREKLERENRYQDSYDTREFKEVVGALLPWHKLWVDTFLGRVSADRLASAVEEVRTASSKAEYSYREQSHTSDEIAQIWFGIYVESGAYDSEHIDVFNQWKRSLSRPLFTPTLDHVSRVASQTNSLREQSIQYSYESYKLTRNERADAETQSDSYVQLARSILLVSTSESAAYFNHAIEVASKVGDENLARWDAMLALANRASDNQRPDLESAYRMSRCAELTYDYVARDKHFDWEATVRAITGLCPASSLTILSRWRDRGFGQTERLLPVAVSLLLNRKSLDPRVALGLVGFRADWDHIFLLKKALDACATKAQKETVSNFLYYYITVEGQGARDWEALRKLCSSHRLTLPDIANLSAFEERKTAFASFTSDFDPNSESGSSRIEEGGWNGVFAGIDLFRPADISLAYQRFEKLDRSYHTDRFFAEACHRISVGREGEFITAFRGVANFDLYSLRHLIEQIPDEWKGRLTVQSALADTLKTFCRRYCMQMFRSQYYEVLPLEATCEMSGISEGELAEVTLSAIGESAERLDAGRLFTMVGPLSVELSSSEALEALAYGLDLFEGVLDDNDGDGPWRESLRPPSGVESAVAGYIWAGLAAPRATVRWEAAHVVRALCTLGQEAVLGDLIGVAKEGSAGPFADSRLYFYSLHARQWLLIGLARAAKETPEILLPHSDFIIQAALNGETHVLIRAFAARAALALVNSGVVKCDSDVRRRLENINVSDLPGIQSRTHKRFGRQEPENADQEEDKFYFGIDIGPYWFDPLGRCFEKSQAEIEGEAKRVIREAWQYSGASRWDEDERTRRSIFKDGDTSHSHGSYPAVDDLHFYLSYHAMMVVAGQLLATTPCHFDADGLDDFNNWLSRHDLSRADGNWLADRTDPVPFEWPQWKDENETDGWRWSLARDDFDRILQLATGQMNVWGHWTVVSGTREESIFVTSALVSRSCSKALLRALQTAKDPHSYRIPPSGDELEIDQGDFQLKGWVAALDPENGLDEHDPWSGSIRYPPTGPAPFVEELMRLSSDSERRVWCAQHNGETEDTLRSQVWGRFREKDDENDAENGSRLQASVPFVLEFLRKIDMDLIIKIEVTRSIRRSRYESYKDDDIGYIPPSARLFLVRPDGNVSTV